jgi:arginase family enzyme
MSVEERRAVDETATADNRTATMNVCLIQVPYMAGDERAGSAQGPDHSVAGGAERLVTVDGATTRTVRVERGDAFRDSASASFAVCRDLARLVRQAVEAGEFPFVLAGGCDASKGILSGFDHASTGVVWFDAHGIVDSGVLKSSAAISPACPWP